jgi:hypothetical protein
LLHMNRCISSLNVLHTWDCLLISLL